jgi:hypothetical protein
MVGKVVGGRSGVQILGGRSSKRNNWMARWRREEESIKDVEEGVGVSEKLPGNPPNDWVCEVVEGDDGLELVVADELYDTLVSIADHLGMSVEELVRDSLQRTTETEQLDTDTQ